MFVVLFHKYVLVVIVCLEMCGICLFNDGYSYTGVQPKRRYDRYGKWVKGTCKRPDSGDCSVLLTCCDQKRGNRIDKRICDGDNCKPQVKTERTKSCIIRCHGEGMTYTS